MFELTVAALAVALLVAIVALLIAFRGRRNEILLARFDHLVRDNERLERELRAAIELSASQHRLETGARLTELQSGLAQQMTGLAGMQGQQVAQQLGDLARATQLGLGEVRTTLASQLASLQQGNETKLDQMRATVEEKLQTTLEARLGESFRLVSERLEQVHRGLGEMQTLAAGVGDLKRMLTNVKARGTYGEVQLAGLLEQVLATDQYERNVEIRAGTGERVEFAVKMPGRREGEPCWLPIDAKFPIEDYERLLNAIDAADPIGVEASGKALERAVRNEARTIRAKYIESPQTTDFAILFLPSEGLFAEVLRRPGLAESLNRECRVVVAGPTTLFAMLNSLQMGFRTLALEKRSAEVWQVLGAVKTEFGKFGDVLTKLRSQLQVAAKTIDDAETRTRQMGRALRTVEALPVEQTTQLLPPTPARDG